MLEMADEYYRVCIQGWAEAVSERYGADDMQRIQSEAWTTMILPQLRVMTDSWMELTEGETDDLLARTEADVAAQLAARRTVLVNPYKPDPEWVRLLQRAAGETGPG